MIAIIPARSGSKGVPGKNIKLLNGKPLIAFSIEAAQKSKYVEKIIISTDDSEIANIAESLGAYVPFLRPKELAQDNSLAMDVYCYTIEQLNNRFNFNINEFVVLQPTSPLRTSEDIDSAIELFYKKNADAVISYYEAPHPPIWAKKIDENGLIQNYFEFDSSLKNRQEIDKAYMPNGAIYIFKYNILKEKHTYYTENTYPYLMPAERSIDIDTLLDFKIAEFLMKEV